MLECITQLTRNISIPPSIPVRRGHVLEFQWGDRRHYFEVSGYLLVEKMLGGYRYHEECSVQEGTKATIIPQGDENGPQWASGGGRCDLMLIAQQRPTLVFLQRSRQRRAWQISGRNDTVIWNTECPPRWPRHIPASAPWTERVMDVMASTGRVAGCITSDASYLLKALPCHQFWKGPEHEVRRQGAIVFTDSVWREGKLQGKGLILVLIARNIPEWLEGLANGAELVSFLGGLQGGTAIAERHQYYPHLETDCNSLIRRGFKEYSRYGQRSLNCRRHGYLYQ